MLMRHALVLLGECAAWLGYQLGFRKRVTLENIQRAFPNASTSWQRRTALSSYRSLGRTFAEFVFLRYAPLSTIRSHTKVVNPSCYQDTLPEGRGLIVVAAHYSNWEWLALGGALVLHSNFAIVRKNIQTSFTEQFLERMRIRSGNTLINSGDVRSMLRTLQAKQCIALLADQAAPSESVKIDFMGSRTPTQEGPAWLALRTGAQILFAECQRSAGNIYEITFHPIEVDRSDTVETLTQKHAQILETIIRKNPVPWVWQHKRWKYTP